MLCPHCHKLVDAFDPDEEPTGRSAAAMRLYRIWIGAFDGFTVERCQVVIEVVTILKDLAPEQFRRLTDAITNGPRLKRILGP